MIKLNAGPTYIMNESDICFYMSITKEENSSLLIAASANENIPDEDLTLTGQLTRRLSFRRTSFNMGRSPSMAETKPLNKTCKFMVPYLSEPRKNYITVYLKILKS